MNNEDRIRFRELNQTIFRQSHFIVANIYIGISIILVSVDNWFGGIMFLLLAFVYLIMQLKN